MTIRQLAAVSLRFFALWLCFNAASGLVILFKVKQANGLASIPGAGYSLGFMLALAVVVWISAPRIAGAMVSGLRQTEASPLSLYDLVIAGCVLLGLWWLKEGVAGLADAWLRAQTLSALSGQSAYASMDAGARARVGYYVCETLLAIALLTRPRVVAGWLLGRIRGAATDV